MNNFATHHIHGHSHERFRSHAKFKLHKGYRKRIFCCVNCGKEGHVYKECQEPITSFGIIAVKGSSSETGNISPGTIDIISRGRCEKHKENAPDCIPVADPKTEPGTILYLMVQRKDTMGYIDFIRGKYPDNDQMRKMTILKTYLEEMTCEERERLAQHSFEYLWDCVWMNKDSKLYINEYMDAKEKYAKLNIKRLLDATECSWTEQEYGFPKGRKNMHESNIDCARREFKEESGYTQTDIRLLSEKPWEEIFIGTNGVAYRHVYYIAEVPASIGLPKIDLHDVRQAGEISNLGWFTYDQCMKIIRPYDIAKKDLLSRIHEKYKNKYVAVTL